jgi:hypothetical protein
MSLKLVKVHSNIKILRRATCFSHRRPSADNFLVMIPLHSALSKFLLICSSSYHILACGHLCNVQYLLINTALYYKFLLFCVCKCWCISLVCHSLVCVYCGLLIIFFIFFCVYCSYLHILLGVACAAICRQVRVVSEISDCLYQYVYRSCAYSFCWFFRCSSFLGCLNTYPSSKSLWYPRYRLSWRMCVLYLIYDLNNQNFHCYFQWLECALYLSIWKWTYVCMYVCMCVCVCVCVCSGITIFRRMIYLVSFSSFTWL